MPYSVKGLFEINEDMVQILLMLVVIFTQDSKVKDLFCCASSGSEPSLFFNNYFFNLGFMPFQGDFQHDFARIPDEADSYVVLAELQVALFRECNNQRLSPWGGSFSCSTDPVILLSTPADFPFFSDATAISTSSRRIGCRSSYGDWLQSSTALSPQLS